MPKTKFWDDVHTGAKQMQRDAKSKSSLGHLKGMAGRGLRHVGRMEAMRTGDTRLAHGGKPWFAPPDENINRDLEPGLQKAGAPNWLETSWKDFRTPVEEHKLTPGFSKWNTDRKKIEEMGVMLQGELLTNTRKAQISQQSFMDWTRLYKFHSKVEPQEQTQEIPGM